MVCVNSFVFVKVFPGVFMCGLLHGLVLGKEQCLHEMENSSSNLLNRKGDKVMNLAFTRSKV